MAAQCDSMAGALGAGGYTATISPLVVQRRHERPANAMRASYSSRTQPASGGNRRAPPCAECASRSRSHGDAPVGEACAARAC